MCEHTATKTWIISCHVSSVTIAISEYLYCLKDRMMETTYFISIPGKRFEKNTLGNSVNSLKYILKWNMEK